MAFQAGSILATLGLDTAPYAQGMLQATSIAQLFPQTVTNFLANPLLGVIGIAKQTTGALVGMFDAAQDRADDVHDMAEAVGVSADELSGLGKVAGQAGSSINAVADAYKFLGRNAAEAAQGNKSNVENFGRLGITVTDATGKMKALPVLMREVADAMVRLPEGGARTQAAMDLLGRSGTDLIPTLKAGSAAIDEQIAKYRSWGATITQESANSADAWGDSMGEISLAWEGVQNTLGEQLRVALLPELENLLKWITSNQPAIREGISEIVGGVREVVPVVGEVIGSLRELLKLRQDARDFFGITDPNERFGQPFAPTSNSQIASTDLTSPVKAAGLEGLEKADEILDNYNVAARALIAT
ncbi:MAG: phage tail tape measure protein, partial [Tepidisphaeraceae bacterium]